MFHGKAHHTKGGLTCRNLKTNKSGHIVSLRSSEAARKRWKDRMADPRFRKKWEAEKKPKKAGSDRRNANRRHHGACGNHLHNKADTLEANGRKRYRSPVRVHRHKKKSSRKLSHKKKSHKKKSHKKSHRKSHRK